MKRNCLLIIPLFVLSSCNFDIFNKNKSYDFDVDTPFINENPTKHNYLDERDYEYTNVLPFPGALCHNIDDLQAVADYYAFYKVEKFSVIMADDYEYVSNFKPIERELNYLYWHEELINGVLGMNATVNKHNPNRLDFTYTIYQNAINTYDQSAFMFEDLSYVEPTSSRSDDYDDFATDDVNKPILDVATSQQLWYAAEHGYRINCLPDSRAEFYYNEAKELLRDIIDADMTYFEKNKVIYDYIEHHTTYDYEGAYSLEGKEVSNPKLYPDEYCAQDKCYFLEGFFDDKDNRRVVCDGFAKVYTLLGRMEGLEIIRGSGTSDKEWKTREVPGHAYCFVKYDNSWYLSDCTWGQAGFNGANSILFVLNHKYFLTQHRDIEPYSMVKNSSLNVVYDFDRDESFYSQYFKTSSFEYNGRTFSKYVETYDNELANAVFNMLNENPFSQISLYFSSADEFRTFSDSFSTNSNVRTLTGYYDDCCGNGVEGIFVSL